MINQWILDIGLNHSRVAAYAFSVQLQNAQPRNQPGQQANGRQLQKARLQIAFDGRTGQCAGHKPLLVSQQVTGTDQPSHTVPYQHHRQVGKVHRHPEPHVQGLDVTAVDQHLVRKIRGLAVTFEIHDRQLVCHLSPATVRCFLCFYK